MSRDVNSEEIGTHKRVERCASWEKLKNFGSKLSKVKNFDCCRVNYAKQILDPREPSGKWISLMLCVISISIDPLFFYIPEIVSAGCLALDPRLAVVAFILRSAVDLIYVIYVYFQRRTHVDNSSFCCRLFRQFKSIEGYIDLLAVLPLPQVAIITLSMTTGIIKYYDAMKVLKYFVFFQFVPRVIRIYPLLRKATGTFGILGEVTWAKAAFNLYIYLLSGHVFGALWYFFAIEREIQCRGEHDSIDERDYFCLYITENCSAKSDYDFGIFQAVFESKVTKGDFPPRFMYCFRWGLQSLSGHRWTFLLFLSPLCFGQNLETSADIWENIFAITITIASLVLFVFLIGNMQLYIQSGTSRSEETKLKMREIEHWKPFKNLPENLQRQVKEHQLYVWRETKGVDVENSLNNLRKDLRRNIKSELCLKLLKKVPNFESISDQRLNAMCKRLEHVLYSDETYIVRKNDPVDEMLFIIRGKLLIDDSSNDNDENFVEYQSNLCGGELSTWAQDCPSLSNLPISTTNIKTDIGGVEAFALSADDLKDVFTQLK